MTEEVQVDRSVRRLTELVHLLHELVRLSASRPATNRARRRGATATARSTPLLPAIGAWTMGNSTPSRTMSGLSTATRAHYARIVRRTNGRLTAVHVTERSEARGARRRPVRGGAITVVVVMAPHACPRVLGGTADACIPGVRWL